MATMQSIRYSSVRIFADPDNPTDVTVMSVSLEIPAEKMTLTVTQNTDTHVTFGVTIRDLYQLQAFLREAVAMFLDAKAQSQTYKISEAEIEAAAKEGWLASVRNNGINDQVDLEETWNQYEQLRKIWFEVAKSSLHAAALQRHEEGRL